MQVTVEETVDQRRLEHAGDRETDEIDRGVTVSLERLILGGRYAVDALHHEHPLGHQTGDRRRDQHVDRRAFERERHLHDRRRLQPEIDLLGEQPHHQFEAAVQVRDAQSFVATLDETKDRQQIRGVCGDDADDARPADLQHDLGAVAQRRLVHLRDRRRRHRAHVPGPEVLRDARGLEHLGDRLRRRRRHGIATPRERVGNPRRRKPSGARHQLPEFHVGGATPQRQAREHRDDGLGVAAAQHRHQIGRGQAGEARESDDRAAVERRRRDDLVGADRGFGQQFRQSREQAVGLLGQPLSPVHPRAGLHRSVPTASR